MSRIYLVYAARRAMLSMWIAALAVCTSAGTAVADEPRPSDKPNIVFILVDDLGWADIGCFGSSFYQTPNIDQLAKSGMRLTSAYAACPVCSPTRASILTGKYPARTGITDYIGAPQPQNWKRNTPLLPAPYKTQLDADETTLPEALKQHGYATFFAGKWHLGPQGSWPENHGFDINKGGIDRGGPYGGKKYFSPYGNPRLEDGPEGEHLPDRLAAETEQFITDNKDQPFLAYLSFYSVHTPLIGRPDLIEKYKNKKSQMQFGEIWGEEPPRKVRLVQEHAVYAAMVEAMDAAVGKVLDALKANDLEKNTIVIFFSDNGGLSTSEGHPTSNLPLRAGKGWIYEGGIREPCIIRVPGMTAAGSENDLPFTSTDFYPTLLDLAGLELLPNQHVDGVSIKPMLQGGNGDFQRGPIYWHYPHYGNQGGTPNSAIRHGDYKLIEFFEDGRVALFNVVADIGEKINLAEKMPEKAAAMRQMLHEWRKSVNAKLPTANDPQEP